MDGAARAWLCVIVVLTGCGCGGPFSPTLNAGNAVSLRVISGETGDPVAAAVVVIDGRRTVTDTDGLAVIDTPGDAQIESPRFIPRRTTARPGTVTLWPRGEAYPDSYVRALLYQRAYQTHESALGAQAPMRRVIAASVDIVPAPALYNDPAARLAHEQAAASLTEATDGQVVFNVRATAATGILVRSFVDATLPAGDALTDRDLRGDTIVGGRIGYGSIGVARSARFIAHELGHLLGLEHSTVRTDLMYYAVDRDRPPVFSANERLTIRLLLQRAPGNRFPDTDASITNAD
jgi:hypothetical protein